MSTLAVMILLALSAPAAAQATTSTTSTTTELTGNIPATCAGEVIPATGTLHVVMHTTQTKGMTSRVFHLNLHGSGVGQDTGLQYQWMQSSVTVFNFRGDSSAGPTEFTREDLVLVISQGNANDFFRRSFSHTTINANGEMTAHTDFFVRECD